MGRAKKDWLLMALVLALVAGFAPRDPLFPEPDFPWIFLLTGLIGGAAVINIAARAGAYRSNHERERVVANYGVGTLIQGAQFFTLVVIAVVSAMLSGLDEATWPMYILYVLLVYALNLILLSRKLTGEDREEVAAPEPEPEPEPEPSLPARRFGPWPAESALVLAVVLSIVVALLAQVSPSPPYRAADLLWRVVVFGVLPQCVLFLGVLLYRSRRFTAIAAVAIGLSWLSVGDLVIRALGAG